MTARIARLRIKNKHPAVKCIIVKRTTKLDILLALISMIEVRIQAIAAYRWRSSLSLWTNRYVRTTTIKLNTNNKNEAILRHVTFWCVGFNNFFIFKWSSLYYWWWDVIGRGDVGGVLNTHMSYEALRCCYMNDEKREEEEADRRGHHHHNIYIYPHATYIHTQPAFLYGIMNPSLSLIH